MGDNFSAFSLGLGLLLDFLETFLGKRVLPAVHSDVFSSILVLSSMKGWVVDVSLWSLILKILGEQELSDLVLSESSVEDVEVPDEVLFGRNILFIGVEVGEPGVSGDTVVVAEVSSEGHGEDDSGSAKVAN